MTTWTLDKGHTTVGFSARHMMIHTVRGTFAEATGTVEFDEVHPEASRVEARVATASIATGVEDRDNHLRSADFFDSAEFPDMTFVSTSVRAGKDGEFAVTGDLTIRDVTREVVLEGEISGPVADFEGKRRIGVSVSGEINREDFGLRWNAVLEAGTIVVGKTVKLQIEAEAVEAAVASIAA
jgi:polyisoprenoid-binding protein YceI